MDRGRGGCTKNFELTRRQASGICGLLARVRMTTSNPPGRAHSLAQVCHRRERSERHAPHGRPIHEAADSERHPAWPTSAKRATTKSNCTAKLPSNSSTWVTARWRRVFTQIAADRETPCRVSTPSATNSSPRRNKEVCVMATALVKHLEGTQGHTRNNSYAPRCGRSCPRDLPGPDEARRG